MRLDPHAGRMVQAVWFDNGRQRPGHLLLIIHHLVVDGVSWRILIPDLQAAWQSASAGQTVALPSSGTSLRRWSERLSAEAINPARTGELAFWTAMLDASGVLCSMLRLILSVTPWRAPSGSRLHFLRP